MASFCFVTAREATARERTDDSIFLRYIWPVLHLIKLSVGPKDLADLQARYINRLARGERLVHQTRMFPRRADEILAGGSIYWVIAGAVRGRQKLLAIEEQKGDDGHPCAGLVLDTRLVPVRPRLHKPFQGWRYFKPEDAPPDMAGEEEASGIDALPPALRRELEAVGLL
ncbi:DUF1489 domain-containing protein [Acetobacteraceae bacterium H6797]|nr:DUF1489 domain-containing protein [Acetobacteraceae bacterium H6797]